MSRDMGACTTVKLEFSLGIWLAKVGEPLAGRI